MIDPSTLIKSKYPFEKLSRLNILLVEDNPLNIKLISILLSQHSLKLQLAQHGEEAVEKIKENYFDIVLMDIEMPVMNGYEATTVIRQQLKSNVPIIAMTAHNRNGEREKCLQLGMNAYISKPIEEELLFSIMQDLIFGHTISEIKNGIASSAISITDKVCDLGYLLTAVRGNKKVVHEIIDIFLKETPGELANLEAAIGKADHQLISNIAHKLRSSFSLLGITVLTPIFEAMEHLSNTASPIEKIKQLTRRVIIVFEQAKAEMEFETVTLL
ncbi:MAG: response regulator [Ferruginibacter sp.]